MMSTRAQREPYSLLPQADLAAEIEGLREDLRTERDRHLRTLADFKNYRRRIERDGNKIAEEGNREVLRSLLTIVDDLENALQWTNHGEQALAKGVPIIHKKIIALLEAHGVRSFESLNMPFTPDLHQAVAVTERAGVEPGTVVEVLRQGYLWKDGLLRPAQVQVAE
jgi:molecular chaperone GrpE